MLLQIARDLTPGGGGWNRLHSDDGAERFASYELLGGPHMSAVYVKLNGRDGAVSSVDTLVFPNRPALANALQSSESMGKLAKAAITHVFESDYRLPLVSDPVAARAAISRLAIHFGTVAYEIIAPWGDSLVHLDLTLNIDPTDVTVADKAV